MTIRSQKRMGARLAVGAAALAGTIALGSLPLLSILPLEAEAAAAPTLKSANVANYAGVVENSTSRTLYLLSVEKGMKLHCVGGCLKVWRPLLVPSATKHVSVGAGVKGVIGFVKRTSTTKQVTFNSYPLYTYAGDSAANQSHGEAVSADGGIWHLVHAGAKTAAASPVAPLLQSANIAGWPGVLENHTSFSLYVLSTEKGGAIHCTGTCASIWLPVLVTSTTSSIAVGPGVKGKVGFVTRGTMKQVTFNTYPVYTYTGDTGPNQSNGEDVSADGGTWTLVHAAATSATATPDVVRPSSGGGWAAGR